MCVCVQQTQGAASTAPDTRDAAATATSSNGITGQSLSSAARALSSDVHDATLRWLWRWGWVLWIWRRLHPGGGVLQSPKNAVSAAERWNGGGYMKSKTGKESGRLKTEDGREPDPPERCIRGLVATLPS